MSIEEGRGPGGRGAGLSRSDIVAAALRLMQDHGVEWFSMRKLATDLGVSPGALYWHFPNKENLFAGVMDSVGLEPSWDAASSGTPRERLAGHVRILHDYWRDHPVLVALGRKVRPTASARHSTEGIAIIREFGFDEPAARLHWRALVWLALGFFYVEQGVTESTHHEPIAPGRYQVSLGDQPEIIDTDALFEHLLGLTLDGLEQAAGGFC
ncbi:MAG: helix-turn-helix domain-containing protein [Acidimicrobiales bacterium]